MRNNKRIFWLVPVLLSLLAIGCTATVEETPAGPATANVPGEGPSATGVVTGATTSATTTLPPVDPTYQAMIAARRSPEVPDLPFPDNPDPTQCGIPTQWGNDGQAWLSGTYQGELVQPVVFLYDSHLRLDVTAEAEHGSEVEVILYQQNPLTDYYLVKIKGAEPTAQGWVPGPFLSFEPVPPAGN